MIEAAFYAPMKPPDHPRPSGDRTMARALMAAMEQAGFAAEVASELRSRDGSGDAAVQAELFVLLDADNNGELSAEEHAAQTREISKLARKKAMFKKLDANNDGVLVPEEMPRRGDRLRAADTNGDGQVTRQEIRAMRAG